MERTQPNPATHEPRTWDDDNEPVIPRFPRPRKPQAIRIADIYVAAATADHLAHCDRCREQDAEFESRYAEYGASTARRDRLQLGLRPLAGQKGGRK
jgi:hypothetical protein